MPTRNYVVYTVRVIAGAPPIHADVEIRGPSWAVIEAVARVELINRQKDEGPPNPREPLAGVENGVQPAALSTQQDTPAEHTDTAACTCDWTGCAVHDDSPDH